MDIFGRKRIAELERKLEETKRERDDYMSKAFEYSSKLDSIEGTLRTVPADCIQGDWCKACEFVEEFKIHERTGYGYYGAVTKYVCGKGKSCSNFVQKKIEEE